MSHPIRATWLASGLLATSLLACSLGALATPVTISALIADHDGSELTVGPAATDASGAPVANGGFTIYRIDSAADGTVGNGVDDRTYGTFDLRTDPRYADFVNLVWFNHDRGVTLTAVLELVLSIGNPLYHNDQVSFDGDPFIGDPDIGDQLASDFTQMRPNRPDLHRVQIQLDRYYPRDWVAGYLNGGMASSIDTFFNDGRVRFEYGDDATVTLARISFTANVPEPSSLALALPALLGGWWVRRRRD